MRTASAITTKTTSKGNCNKTGDSVEEYLPTGSLFSEETRPLRLRSLVEGPWPEKENRTVFGILSQLLIPATNYKCQVSMRVVLLTPDGRQRRAQFIK